LKKKSGDVEESGWEWAELSNISGASRGDHYRYIVFRSQLNNQKYLLKIPGTVDEEVFKKQYDKDGKVYRTCVIVINRNEIEGATLIHWYNKKFRYSEHIQRHEKWAWWWSVPFK